MTDHDRPGTQALPAVRRSSSDLGGYQFAVDKLHEDRTQVEQQKAALRAEWRQLDATQRIRSVFLSARRTMQAEAACMSWPTDDHDQEAGR